MSPIFEGSENLTGAKQPERLEAVNGSFSYFSMLGVTPQIGRLFGPQDFALGFAPVAVISDGLWRLLMAPIQMLSAVASGSTMIPLQLSGFCHADFAILGRRFRRRRRVWRRRIQRRSLFPANARYPDFKIWNRTT